MKKNPIFLKKMEFIPDFPLNFSSWIFTDRARERCRFELDKIRTRYSDCSNDLTDKDIDYYLSTCWHGVIIVSSDGKLRGFALCDRPNGQHSFRTKIIKGDNVAIKLMMRFLKLKAGCKYTYEWIMIVDQDKIHLFQEHGFDICEQNGITEDGRIQMFNKEKRQIFGINPNL